MSRFPIHTFTRDGSEIVTPGVVRPPLYRVLGLPAGSAAAEALTQAHYGRIHAFVAQSRRAADIGGLPQFRRIIDMGSEIRLAYQRQQGDEFITLDARNIPVERGPALKEEVKFRVELGVQVEETCETRGGDTYDHADTIEGALLYFISSNWAGMSGDKRNTAFYWNYAQIAEYPFRDNDYNMDAGNPAPRAFVYEGGVTLAEAGISATPLILTGGGNLVTQDLHHAGYYSLPSTTGALFDLYISAYIKFSYAGIHEQTVVFDPDIAGLFGTDEPEFGEGYPFTPNNIFQYVHDRETIYTTTTTTTRLEIYTSGKVRIRVETTTQENEVFEPGTGPNPAIPPGAPWGPCGGGPPEE